MTGNGKFAVVAGIGQCTRRSECCYAVSELKQARLFFVSGKGKGRSHAPPGGSIRIALRAVYITARRSRKPNRLQCLAHARVGLMPKLKSRSLRLFVSPMRVWG